MSLGSYWCGVRLGPVWDLSGMGLGFVVICFAISAMCFFKFVLITGQITYPLWANINGQNGFEGIHLFYEVNRFHGFRLRNDWDPFRVGF